MRQSDRNIGGRGDDRGKEAGEEKEGLKSDIWIFHRRQTPTQGTAMTSSERLSPPLSDKNSHLQNVPVGEIKYIYKKRLMDHSNNEVTTWGLNSCNYFCLVEHQNHMITVAVTPISKVRNVTLEGMRVFRLQRCYITGVLVCVCVCVL